MKRPAAKLVAKSAAKAKTGPKEAPQKDLSLRILYVAGEILQQWHLTCPKTWTTTQVKDAVKNQLKAQGDLQKLLHVGGELIPGGSVLEEVGLQDGSEIYAVLQKTRGARCDVEPESEEDQDDSEYELDDDLYDMDYTRPATGEWDACIHGCGNRGCEYYGGECRNCYDEH
ncbi:unnamed protein product [Symbiodinium pilosum]|uniref:Ubiquitin-like domain-containing protein n=1 Tax=Symbiodinium pilosum TaxID=2952 RepID=A0A812IUT7_SYMPI|nr:unnamed protein product [Symbiodinium pilosum]